MRGMQGSLRRDVVLRKMFEKENGYTKNIYVLDAETSINIKIHTND